MDIIVCVKQVPDTSKVEVDPVTGVLKRDGIESKMNPYDLFALETALSLRERYGGRVRTLTMGPPQAKETLMETLYMGADEAVLLSDRKFAGSDVAATAYVISRGIKSMGKFDLIICGKQTTDGDTAQVGPETAECLGLEHAVNVYELGDVVNEAITVVLNLDDVQQTQLMKMPCLITIEKDANTPRLPSYRRKSTVQSGQIKTLTFSDLPETDEMYCGLKGSPTQVERIFPPEKKVDKRVIKGDAKQLADSLANFLCDRKFI